MSASGSPDLRSIVANLEIETPNGDRLSLRGDGGDMTLAAASVAALWRTQRLSHTLLGAGAMPWITSSPRVDMNVSVGARVVARVEATPFGKTRVRLRWLALLRSLF